MAALLMGALTSGVCFYVSEYVVRGRIDDALDVFGVHGVGGICGAVLTAVFASSLVPGNQIDGLLAGNTGLLARQTTAIFAVAAYSAIGTLVILKVINAVTLIRVSSDDEATGLDISQHGESVAA
jgi:Amt family ammonium transporter